MNHSVEQPISINTGASVLRIASQLDPNLHPEIQHNLDQHLSISVRVLPFHPQQQHTLQNADIVLAAPRDWPQEKPQGWPFRIKWIQLLSSGIDYYPKWLFEDVVVTSSRGASSGALAEYVIAAIFAQAKPLEQYAIHHKKDWQKQQFPQLAGSTLGIVGYGAIGQRLAKIALALELKVLVLRKQPITETGIQLVSSIEALIAQSDYVVLAAPATEDTYHLIDEKRLKLAKPNLHLINIARGSLIDQDSLIVALNKGQIAHATLDVSTPEPLPEGHVLYDHPKVTLTPHSAASAVSAYQRLLTQFYQNLDRFLLSKPLHNQVDLYQGY